MAIFQFEKTEHYHLLTHDQSRFRNPQYWQKFTNFQSNILSSMYIDEYILISDHCSINIYKLTHEALIISIADDIFCNNSLYFGYKKTGQNHMKLIEKRKNTHLF